MLRQRRLRRVRKRRRASGHSDPADGAEDQLGEALLSGRFLTGADTVATRPKCIGDVCISRATRCTQGDRKAAMPRNAPTEGSG